MCVQDWKINELRTRFFFVVRIKKLTNGELCFTFDFSRNDTVENFTTQCDNPDDGEEYKTEFPPS